MHRLKKAWFAQPHCHPISLVFRYILFHIQSSQCKESSSATGRYEKMDPLSITTGAIALLGAVGKTIMAVTSFIRGCREARTDLTAVNRELMELQIVLELLRDDSAINENDVFPEALRAQVLSVITNCNAIVEQINTVLEKHDASISTPLRWVVSGKNEVANLRMSLEAHRGSLNLALEMINISLSKSTKEDTAVIRSDMVKVTQDTTVIRSDMTRIKQDTGQIVQIMEELAVLRAIVANMRSSPQAAGSNYILQQYLDSLTSYAETVVQEDLNESDHYNPSVGSQRSCLDFQEAAPTKGNVSPKARGKGPEMESGGSDTIGMTPLEERAGGDDDNSSRQPDPGQGLPEAPFQDVNRGFSHVGITSQYEVVVEGHTPMVYNKPVLFSDAAMIPVSEAPNIQSRNYTQKSNILWSQDNSAVEATNLICVGDGAAGKTALLEKWSHGLFIEVARLPIHEEYSKTSLINGKLCKFTVQDSQGQEDYDGLRRLSYRGRDIVLICFNIASPSSLVNVLQKWILEVLKFSPKIPYLLIGLKKDLRFDPETLKRLERYNQKPVSPEEGEDVREKIGAFSYIECSAKTSEDYYADLGVSQSASKQQIRRAYLSLARATHPDKKPDKSTDAAGFRKVQEAWEYLSDSTKRANYDKIYLDVQYAWARYKEEQEWGRQREERRAAEARAERERKAAEAERARKREEQRRAAEEKARLDKLREEKARQAEERSHEAARRGWDDRQRAAEERMHQERVAEAERRSEEVAARRRLEQEKEASERLRAAELEERLDTARRRWKEMREACESSSCKTELRQPSPILSTGCAHPRFQWPKRKAQAGCRFCGVVRKKWAFVCPECGVSACPACMKEFCR
ncbi:hypothetical protein GQX73_g7104 [Xylaria multiplex]|uniref:J domain-containing protein n=1 Tax=Xylaria multiplex TaxID=323545 RepID=A0A7C8IQH5_9PEZI|nr:hypothetical protein GQX73_g7104 [Xylaria multiplex]